MSREIFGSVETVNMPDLGIEVLAKVDTGAWSGTLHCTDIYEEDNRLYFSPLGNPEYKTSVNEYELRIVRSASGHEQSRYIIPITLEIKGKAYHTTLGLGDRSDMQREMLLGRKFLIENNIVVDVALTVDQDKEAEKYL